MPAYGWGGVFVRLLVDFYIRRVIADPSNGVYHVVSIGCEPSAVLQNRIANVLESFLFLFETAQVSKGSIYLLTPANERALERGVPFSPRLANIHHLRVPLDLLPEGLQESRELHEVFHGDSLIAAAEQNASSHAELLNNVIPDYQQICPL